MSLRATTGALLLALALALLTPLPSFAIGRDLTPVRIATPPYGAQSCAAGATEKGFLLRWSSGTRNYGTTADSAGVPRLPATSASPFTEWLFPDGDGFIGLSQNGIAELDADGTILRSARFETETLTFSRAAFDRTNFFLFQVVSGGYNALIVDRNGHVLSTTMLPIAAGTVTAAEVAASADGGFTLLVCAADEGIYALRISTAGKVTGKVNVALGNGFGGSLVAIATNMVSGQTVAAWATSGSAFVHTAALHAESAGADVILPSAGDRSTRIALLASGGGFILVRNASGVAAGESLVLASRLDATGAPRDRGITRLLNGSFGAAAATRNTLVLLAFAEWSSGPLSEVSASIGEDASIVRSVPCDVVATAVAQTAPVIASDGVDFFGVWLENTATANTIMAGRVTRSGQPLDGPGIAVASSSASFANRPLYSPGVAFGGGIYLVVFGSQYSHTVLGRRYARDGTPIDSAPFVISHNALAPSVAFGGDRFLVAWILASEDSLGGATVGSDGITGTERLLTPARSLELPEERGPLGQPMISWNGRHFIVAYFMQEEALNNGLPKVSRVRVLRTSPLGDPLDAHTTEIIKGASDPSVACSEQECVVSVPGLDIIQAAVIHDEAALRVDAPKTVADRQLSAYAAVAFDGASYILAWRSGDSLIGVARITRGGQPYAVAVSGTAKAFPTLDPYLAPDFPSSPPAVAANSAGDTAIVTTEFNPGWMIDRARLYFASEFLPRRRAVR